MSTPFVDDSGEVRLSGLLTAPGATVGDVLTVQGDGTIIPAPGGGSQAVSCLIRVTAQNIASASTYYLLWGTDGTIYDNWVDGNELEALPEGIGLTLNADNLETTEAGVWALTLGYGIAAEAGDGTWEGEVSLDNLTSTVRQYRNQPVVPSFPVAQTASVAKKDALSEVLPLPAGAQFATRVSTSVEASGPSLLMAGDLTIVRLA